MSGLASQIFKRQITNDGGQKRYRKIGRGEDVLHRPNQTQFPASSGAREFAHQKVGVEQKDNKPYFNDRPPNRLLHYRNLAHYLVNTKDPCESRIVESIVDAT